MLSPPAQERDTPAVSLPHLTLSVRLCDYADCSWPLHKCARASPTVPRTARCALHHTLLVHRAGLLCTEQASCPRDRQSMIRSYAQHESMHALHAKAHDALNPEHETLKHKDYAHMICGMIV